MALFPFACLCSRAKLTYFRSLGNPNLAAETCFPGSRISDFPGAGQQARVAAMDEQVARFPRRSRSADRRRAGAARPRRVGRAGQPRAAAARPRRLSRPRPCRDRRSWPARRERCRGGPCRQALRRAGIPHATLRAEMKETANLQAAARARRYALLPNGSARSAPRSSPPPIISTTRPRPWSCASRAAPAWRASSGIRPVNAPLVRPLLGWRREELAAIVRDARASFPSPIRATRTAVRPRARPPPPRRSGLARSPRRSPAAPRRWPKPRRR